MSPGSGPRPFTGKKKTREGGGGTPASYIISRGCAGPEMKITSDLGKDTELVGSRQWTHWAHAVIFSDVKAPFHLAASAWVK